MNLKQKLSKKLKKTGGFTLIEMLIVVAIIAILVAVSIPMVNSSLEKAREATDEANLRAAKTIAMVSAIEGKLNGDGVDIVTTATNPGAAYHYDIATGKLATGVGDEDTDKGQSKENKSSYIKVQFDGDLKPTVEWEP